MILTRITGQSQGSACDFLRYERDLNLLNKFARLLPSVDVVAVSQAPSPRPRNGYHI